MLLYRHLGLVVLRVAVLACVEGAVCAGAVVVFVMRDERSLEDRTFNGPVTQKLRCTQMGKIFFSFK